MSAQSPGPDPIALLEAEGRDVCAQCGGAIPAGAPFGQCPGCLLSLASHFSDGGMSADFALLEAMQSGGFGDFELLEELARGGMGVVYRARQISLGREVAVKMILAGELATEESVRRFRNEAAAAARLDHPHIVPVYEIGEHDRQHFFSMRLVPGRRNIAGWARELPDPAGKPVAAAMAKVARAVAFAHERGVLHRDLKPSNILVDPAGEPQVTDFGLAKLVNEKDSAATLSVAILGSPSYMAPEQADGRHGDVTTLTDVHGLGAVLYELLSGRPPFLAATPLATARKVVEELPAPLPNAPRDLATICLKCLAKEPAQRYASALEVAEDLERFLRGEAIRARPVTTLEAVWRWGRRSPKVAALLAALALAFLLGFAGVTWQWRAAEASRRNEETARRFEETARRGEAAAHAQATATVVDLYTSTGLVAAKEEDPTRAALWFAQAAATPGADVASRTANQQRWAAWRGDSVTPLRAFESGLDGPAGSFVWRPVSQDALILRSMRIGGDPGANGDARITQANVWDLPGEKRWLPEIVMTAAAWARDGARVVYGDGQTLRLAEYPSGREIARLPCVSPALSLSASSDGRWVAVGTATPFLWEPATGRTVALPAELGPPIGIEFSRDGLRLLITGQKRRGVCALAEPQRLLFPAVDHQPGTAQGFLAEGGLFVAHDFSNRLRVLKSGTGEEVENYDMSSSQGSAMRAVSPDGRFIARENGDLLERPGGRPWVFARPKNLFRAVSFSQDSSLFAYGSFDDSVRLFHLPDDHAGRAIGWHQDGVLGVSISPDNRLVATSQVGGNLVRIWRLPAPPPVRRLEGLGDSRFKISPDGTMLLPSGTPDFSAPRPLAATRVHRIDTLEPVGPPMPAVLPIMDADFGPAKKSWIVVARSTAARREAAEPPVANSGTVEFVDYLTGVRIGLPVTLDFEPRSLAVHPDGRRVAVYGSHSSLVEIDVASREVRVLHTDPEGHYDHSNAFCRYSPDGRMLLAWGMERPGLAYELSTGRRIPTPQWRESRLMDLDLHGDSVVSASMEARLDFLTLPGCQPAAAPVEETNWLFLCRFSPEGDLVLTGGRGRVARLWDWRSGQPHGPALMHDDEIFAGTFLPPASHAVATAGLDASLRVWDQDSGRPLRAPVKRASGIMNLALTPDGRTLVSALRNGDAIELYDVAALLPAPGLPARDALRLAELDASAEIRGGALEPLSTAKWLEKWRDFRAQHPDWHRW